MKLSRKILSVLLAGIIMVMSFAALSVTASAKSKGSITGYYTNAGTYHMSLSNFTVESQTNGQLWLLDSGSEFYGILLYYKYFYPVKLVADDIDDLDTIAVRDLKIYGANFNDTRSKITASISNMPDGYSYAVSPETSEGAEFVDGLKKAKKGYYTSVAIKNERIYGPDYDGLDFESVSLKLDFGENTDNELTKSEGISVTAMRFYSIDDQIYTGKAIKPNPKITLDPIGQLKKGTDYTLSYKNNTKIGTATITVTMKGRYTGTKTLKFKIVPAATKLKASKSGGKFNLSWSKVSGVDGYQIYYSTNGGSTYKSAGNVSGSKTSAKLSLDTSKKHVFKIRAYKKVNGTKYYGAWSDTVTVKK